MTTLTKKQVIQAGGKVWAHNELERVYLSIDTVNKLTVNNGFPAISNISKKMKNAKTFLDIKSGELKSDVGAVRSHLNGIGIKCVK
jgi:hypothetical protein